MSLHAGLLGAALWLASSLCAAPAFEVAGLSTPESFVVDPATGNYFLSNIAGEPAAKDDNGFITRLGPDGKILALKWVESTKEAPLHAPKGLAVSGKTVYVTDIDHVKGYDTESGKPVADIDFTPHQARFLNDLAADPQGFLFVTDMFANVVYRIEPGASNAVTVVAKGEALEKPNGVAVDPAGGRVVVASWDTGKVSQITAEGTLKPLCEPGAKNLDGVVFDAAGSLYVSSFTGGTIFKITPDGKVATFMEKLETPADIGIDVKKGLLLVPSLKGNWARAYKM